MVGKQCQKYWNSFDSNLPKIRRESGICMLVANDATRCFDIGGKILAKREDA